MGFLRTPKNPMGFFWNPMDFFWNHTDAKQAQKPTQTTSKITFFMVLRALSILYTFSCLATDLFRIPYRTCSITLWEPKTTVSHPAPKFLWCFYGAKSDVGSLKPYAWYGKLIIHTVLAAEGRRRKILKKTIWFSGARKALPKNPKIYMLFCPARSPQTRTLWIFSSDKLTLWIFSPAQTNPMGFFCRQNRMVQKPYGLYKKPQKPYGSTHRVHRVPYG